MGAQQSAVAEPAQSEVVATSGGTAIKLFRFNDEGGAGAWELHAPAVTPHFFDANEDAASAQPRWHLEADEAEAEVTDQFSLELGGRRVIFRGGGAIWALLFPSDGAFRAFTDQYNDRLFANTYGVDNDEDNRAKVFGKDSILHLGGVETADSREAWAADTSMEETPAAEEFRDASVAEHDDIRGVRMGAGERSYLVRDRRIDVLRNVHGGVQPTQQSISLTPTRGGAFTPQKLMLAQRERRMNMLSPGDGRSLFNADIETGKVVAEWSFQKDGMDVGMKDIVNETRAAQLDDRDTFLGLGTNRLVRWDMRDPTGIVQQSASPIVQYAGGKDYASKVNFNCMATSGEGYVVVGSADGQIRLYSERTLTRASTAIPGLGAPITAVDVTFDGKWVLATTAAYLMVVLTTYKDKNNRETNGFKSRMGAAAPRPRLLRLRPEDAGKVGGAPLRAGKFTWVTEAGRQERWIVASCGSNTVLWNFRQVKLARADVVSAGGLTTCMTYHLIPKQESVVDSVFMADKYAPSPTRPDDTSMVIVTQKHVFSLADEDDT